MNGIECSSVEHLEDPDRDWRHAFRREVMVHETQMVDQRAKNLAVPYDFDGAVHYANEMDDDEIRRGAYVIATRAIEDAIRHHDEVAAIQSKRNKGIAA